MAKIVVGKLSMHFVEARRGYRGIESFASQRTLALSPGTAKKRLFR